MNLLIAMLLGEILSITIALTLTILYAVSLHYAAYKMASYAGVRFNKIKRDKMKQLTLMVLLFTFSIGHTIAGETYWGVDLRSLDYKSNGFEADLIAASGKLGYEINDYLSIEGLAGTGISDGTTGSGATSTELSVDHILGIHLKAKYSLGNEFKIYGLVGYSEVKLTANTSTATATDSTSDTSFGAGVTYNLNNDSAISLDYVNYIDKSFLELNGLTLSFIKSF